MASQHAEPRQWIPGGAFLPKLARISSDPLYRLCPLRNGCCARCVHRTLGFLSSVPRAHTRSAAGLIEKAVVLWGKAGQRSEPRAALVKAVDQLTRALDLIARLPSTPAMCRDEIKLQVAILNPLIHTKGFAAAVP